MVKRKINKIVVHHSASPMDETTVSDIKRWHRDRGWDHIGYHRVITADGSVANTLSLNLEGYHVYGKNDDSVGICVCGNFEQELPRDRVLEALESELVKLCKKFGLHAWDIFGHKDAALKEHPTLCPGKNLMAELNPMLAKITSDLGQAQPILDIEEELEERTLWEKIIKRIGDLITGLKNFIGLK